MTDCLTESDLEALIAGHTPRAGQARTDSHLKECEKCRLELERRRSEHQLCDEIKAAYCADTVTAVGDPAPDLPVTADHQVEPDISMSLEGYRLISRIHQGGQGVVYKAVQEATRRVVAVKVLLPGVHASPRERRRFEREIDLAASLHHPNIVTVFDSGVSREGSRFFAMEYIHGKQLNRYLADSAVDLRGLLSLFHKICNAVTYAHQRGVIHRDLKPGNICIDGEGEPHILDFGLAKAAIPSELPWGAPVSVTGEFIGTLAYASPEQTRGDPSLVDIRTDVYSLGVILYEMLTGKYPYEVVGEMADVLRNIVEAEPPKPSTIRRHINDEVETIVLKALAKEKVRRYQSAEALGRDVEHYLRGEAIDAKRDSAWYVIRKLACRNAYATTAVVSLIVILLSSSVVSFDYYRQAQRALLDKGSSDAFATRQATQLAEFGSEMHPAVRRMALGWFLLEWHSGRLDRAGEIRDQTPQGSPERTAMMFLLGEQQPDESVLTGLPPTAAQLGHFVIGERHLKAGRVAEATGAYLSSLELQGKGWLAQAAEARLEYLGRDPTKLAHSERIN